MTDKYLLYIDILGFSALVASNPSRVELIYGVIDSLNVHRHDLFETIVFSDTILVYNREDPKSDEERRYIVWYSIEFAEDLHHRLTGQGIYFRAVLVKGGFRHFSMNNLQAFYGKALISAYLAEKEIPSIGLFITDECNSENDYFRTNPFGNGLNFVYLNRDIERLCQDCGDTFPIEANDFVHLADSYPFLAWQIKFLKDVHEAMRSSEDPKVRLKFLTAWDYYSKRYPNLLVHLTNSQFSLESISPGFNFTQQTQDLAQFIARFSSSPVA